MEGRYRPEVEVAMRGFFESLPERERRLYAAVEAVKLGHGAIRYLARVLDCDEKTIRRGKREMVKPVFLPPGRSRKKGAGDSNCPRSSPVWTTPSPPSSTTTRLATRCVPECVGPTCPCVASART